MLIESVEICREGNVLDFPRSVDQHQRVSDIVKLRLFPVPAFVRDLAKIDLFSYLETSASPL
jgi:hypothetical protein